jgi:hypothetical protein
VLSESDLDWTVRAFAEVIGDSYSLGGMLDLGRTLAAQALRARRRCLTVVRCGPDHR